MAKKKTGVALAVAWPLAKKVAAQVSVIVANNPDLQKRLEGLGRKFADVQKARTPEAKIARAMASVREQASIVLAAEAGSAESVASVQATGWKQRAARSSGRSGSSSTSPARCRSRSSPASRRWRTRSSPRS